MCAFQRCIDYVDTARRSSARSVKQGWVKKACYFRSFLHHVACPCRSVAVSMISRPVHDNMGRPKTQVLWFQVVLYCTQPRLSRTTARSSPVLRRALWMPALRARLWSSPESERTMWPKNLRHLAVTSGWQEPERNGCELPDWWFGRWRELAECFEVTTDRTHQVACRTSPSHPTLLSHTVEPVEHKYCTVVSSQTV